MSVMTCCVIVLAACSDGPVGSSPVPNAGTQSSAQQTVLQVRIVDADAAPLAGMVPIAADGPSLLSKTVAEGTTTTSDGTGRLAFPKDKWVYIRATDPKGHVVSANFLEIQPGDAPDSDDPIDLKMGATASVTASLQHEDGTPARNESVQLVLIHPAHGKWWYVDGTTDDSGAAQFTGLPAGVYALKLDFPDATTATFREVVLAGGEVKDLGVVAAQSAA